MTSSNKIELDNKVDLVLNELRKRHVSSKTERRAARILKTIQTDEITVDEIFVEVLNRLEAFEKIDNLVTTRFNFGTDFNDLVKSVASTIEKYPDGQNALEQIDDALAAMDAEQNKMLELGVHSATSAGDFGRVAEFELLRIGPPTQSDWPDKVRDLAKTYYEEGSTYGINFSLQIAASICANAVKSAFRDDVKAEFRNLEGRSLALIGERGDSKSLEKSVAAYEAALSLYSPETEPFNLAITQNNLANVMSVIGEQGDDKALSRSISLYQAALDIYAKSGSSLQWAKTQNNLANTLLKLGERGDDDALALAMATFEAVLEVYKRETSPWDWAAIQSNFGNALRNLWERGDDAALARSVAAYEAALEVRTRDAAPMLWAMTRENMGVLYLFRAERGERINLDKAIKAFEDALSVFTAEHHSYYFEKASRNLRKAHALRDDTPLTP